MSKKRNIIVYALIACFLLSPIYLFLPPFLSLLPIPTYLNLDKLHHEPIHNRSINIYRDTFWLDDPNWDFRVDFEPTWHSGIPVPSCWNFISGLEYYEGVAHYRRIFNLTKNWTGKEIFLHFRAVNYYCEVTLNGKYLGSHEGGYTPFKFNVTGLLNFLNWNTVMVKVSNILSKQTVPGQLIGWKNYGGIYREVYLEASNRTCIESNFIDDDIDFGSITNVSVTHNITIQNSNSSQDVNCTVQIFNQTLNELSSNSTTFTVPSYSSINLLISQNCTNISPWAPGSPALYYINVSLFDNNTSILLDKMVYRVGFKEVELRNASLYLNNETFLVKGINRHEDYPGWGKIQPYSVLQNDIALLKELNINSIRTFHYCNHPTFLELCDENGFFIIEEPPAWNIPAADIALPSVISSAKTQIIEMIQRDYNHPCILFWGIGNEIASDKPEGRSFVQQMIQTVKAHDNKTPVYFASNQLEDDISQGLADIMAFNPKYGWYYGEIPDLAAFLEFWHGRYPNKPILITEFSAGGQIGDFSGQKYSENFQAYLLSESWKIIRSKGGYCIGGYVSCFADFYDLDRMLNPTPFFNQKGMLSYDRSYKKLAFHVVKGMFNDTPYDYPVELNALPLHPLPNPTDVIVLLIILSGVALIFLYFRKREETLETRVKELLTFNSQGYTQLDLLITIASIASLTIFTSSLIYTFLETTTISLPIFEMPEKIIFRWLFTYGVYLFLPYLFLFYFVLASVATYGIMRLFRVQINFDDVLYLHLKTTWIFLFALPLCLLTFFDIYVLLVSLIVLVGIKMTIDGIYLEKALETTRNKAVLVTILAKSLPLVVIISGFLLYLHIRFDIFNLLSLLL